MHYSDPSVTQNVSAFQDSSHQNFSTTGRAHSCFPTMNLDSLSFFGSRKVVPNVGPNKHASPRWRYHCDWVRSHEEIVAKNICWLLQKRTEIRNWIVEVFRDQVVKKLTRRFLLCETSWKRQINNFSGLFWSETLSEKSWKNIAFSLNFIFGEDSRSVLNFSLFCLYKMWDGCVLKI